MEEKKKKETTKKETKIKTVEKKKKKKVVKEAPAKVKKEKEVSSNEKKGTLSRIITSYKFLYSTFGILLVLVIVLFVAVTVKENKTEGKYSNIVFSIMESNTHNAIYIDLEELEGNQYDLKVANHRGGRLNEKGASYSITVVNETEAEIEVFNDDDLENLMTDQKETKIEGKSMSTTEEEETIYHFRVKEGSKVKEGDRLRIEVDS